MWIESVDQGTEGHAIVPTAREILDVHILKQKTTPSWPHNSIFLDLIGTRCPRIKVAPPVRVKAVLCNSSSLTSYPLVCALHQSSSICLIVLGLLCTATLPPPPPPPNLHRQRYTDTVQSFLWHFRNFPSFFCWSFYQEMFVFYQK